MPPEAKHQEVPAWVYFVAFCVGAIVLAYWLMLGAVYVTEAGISVVRAW